MGIYTKYFSDIEFEVIIPSFIAGKETKRLPFKIHQVDFYPFDMNNKKRNASNKRILKILKKSQPDIVLFGYLRSHPEVGLIHKKKYPLTKWGIFIHAKEAIIDSCIVKTNNLLGRYQRGYTQREAFFYKKILKEADFLFAVSNFSRNLLLKQGIRRRIGVLYPPLNKEKIKKINGAKKILGLQKKLVMLSVGRLIKRKNQQKIINIMPSLLKKFPQLHYLIVGDGPEKENLQKLVTIHNLKKNISIFDKVDDKDLSLFYSACDIFVLPCKFIKPNEVEGFGIVFIEAGAYGKPVIGGRTGGIVEAIIHKKTGYLVDSSSSKDILKRITRLLNSNDLRKKMGKNGRHRANKEFNDKKDNLLLNQFTANNSQKLSPH
mgnify:CR=1 FL=1